MFNPLLIHKDNTPIKNICKNSVVFSIDNFDFGNSDLDSFISQEFIPKLNQKDFNIVFIKDNLSDNYLELYGLTLAYHIRLNESLEYKRFIPIIILSDVDGYILNKLTPLANILFTKNIFVAKNELSSYQYFKKVFDQIPALSEDEYQVEFLNKIEIEQPKDTSGSHDIANKWSIYKWSEILGATSESIDENKKKIEDDLYFKYLKANQEQLEVENIKIQTPTKKGKVLLIDDEWNKGWSDILTKVLSKDGIDFQPLNIDYKDKEWIESSYKILNIMIKRFNPDVVVLDLRLSQTDHETDDIDSYTGIKILQKIHEINAGIQVIMLTATSKSTILEKLYEKKILGYIKKEHPEDKSIDTIENINKFVGLVDKGLERKYLKDIYTLQKEILSNENLSEDIALEVSTIFDILNSNMENKYNFTVLTFSKIFEAISKQFIDESPMKYIDTNQSIGVYDFWNNTINPYNCEKWYKNTQNRLHNIVYERLNMIDEKTHRYICEIINCRNYIAHPNEKKPKGCKLIKNPNYQHILNWFQIIKNILIRTSQNMSN